MLFKDILKEKSLIIEPEFDKLIYLVLKNQTHDGDLLLVHVNGHFNEDALNWTIEPKFSPYMIGPTMAGHSEILHYEFINKYRHQVISSLTHVEYLELLKYTPERRQEIDKFVDDEGLTIQLEMLIYLKIWEGDSFIKKLYQLVRLAYGQPYNWHFKISESNRDTKSTGTREIIIRELIRDRIKTDLPVLYDIFKETYITQIRNSIAHSNYSFLGRGIGLNNYIQKDPASQLKSIEFDKWIDVFHNTKIIYNEMIRIDTAIQKLYEEAAKIHKGLFTIRVNKEYPQNEIEYRNLILHEDYQNWNWAQNEKK